MKKVMYIFIFIFVFMLFNIDGVYAADTDTTNSTNHELKMKDITLECIYKDGGLYTSAYAGESPIGEALNKLAKAAGYNNAETDGIFSINRTTQSLVGVNNVTASKGSNTVIINQMYVKTENGIKCNPTLHNVQVKYDWGNEDNGNQKDVPVDYYKFGADVKKEDTNAGSGKSFGCILLFGLCDDSDMSKVKESSNSSYKLLSERYHLQSTAAEPLTTIYYVKETTESVKQAVQTNANSYISIKVYDNMVLLEKDGRTTRLDGNYSVFKGVTRDEKTNKLSKEVPKTIYINSPEPTTVIDSSSTAAYKYLDGQTVYSFTESKDATHTNEYTLTDKIPNKADQDDGALCDEILPNTSKQLKILIKWSQILVPVFLIVLTALDIGKIVVTGNIDEELPKRKKIIIIRFVVVLVFFFLPVLVRMITGWLKSSGGENTDRIEYIDCLFK